MPLEYICRIVVNALLRSLPFIIFWCAGRAVYLRSRADRGLFVEGRREVWLWFLVIYLILLLQITIFRFGLHWVPLDVPRTTNWQPLVTLRLLTPWAKFYNVVGNIVWFVPLGLALAMVFRPFCYPWWVLLAGLALSCTIEGLQYLFYTGITDVDDVIFNALGALLGWLLYGLWRLVRRKR